MSEEKRVKPYSGSGLSEEDVEKIREIAEAHWSQMQKWFHMIFVDGFIHGYKHGKKEVKG